jgi:hypothetical protein
MYLATTDQGVLLSDDMGTNWTEMQNFPFTHPTRITEDPRDSSLIWVNTYGGGVWKGRLIDNSTSVSEYYNENLTVKVSPNPVINQARILVSNPARIIICDLFGRIVAQSGFVNEYIWRPDSETAKGIYFVRVITGNSVFVEKICLIKK